MTRIMRVRWLKRLACAGLGMVVLVVAACSSSGAGGGSGGGSGGGKAEWVIGSVSDITGPFASSTGTVNKGLAAWAQWTNAHGGIDGHDVKFILMDTGGNTTTGYAEAKKLVEQDHIIAMVGSQTNLYATFAPYLQAHGIPMIGDTLTGELTQYTDYFPEGMTLSAAFSVKALAGKRLGKTKIAYLYCAEVAACAASTTSVKAGAASQGASVVYSSAVSASAPNYLAPCLAARRAGANVMQVFSGSAVVQRVASDCRSQSYDPTFIGDAGTSAVEAKDPNMSGSQIVLPDAPFWAYNYPGGATMKAAFDKYSPGLTSNKDYGEDTVMAWASAELFEAAAQAAKLGNNPTPAQVIKGLYDLKNETLEKMAPPLTYHAGKTTTISCGFIGAIGNGQFTLPYGVKTFCAA